MDIFYGIVTFLVGLGVLLYGVKAVGEALEKTTGTKFRGAVGKLAKNRIGASGLGLSFTLLLQSSTAAMAMFVALCNAGVIVLSQAVAVVFGVNIGAAIIHLLVGIGSVKVLKILSLAIIAGSFMLIFSKKINVRNIAKLLISIGLLFLGITLMSDGMSVINEKGVLDSFIASITNPLLILLLFIAITCILQTSMGAFTILISFVGLLPVNLAFWAVLGINIGTSVSSMLVTLGSSTNAKRTGITHVLFNIFGTLLFAIILAFVPLGNIFAGFIGSEVFAIILFDILFNVIMAALLLPFVKYIAKLTTLIFKDKEKPRPQQELIIDESTVDSGAAAVPLVLNNLIEIYTKLISNFFKSIENLFNHKEVQRKWLDMECKNINEATIELEKVLLKIGSGLSEGDQEKVSKMLDIVHKNRTVIRKIQKITFYSWRYESKRKQFNASQEKSIKEMCDNILLISIASLTALRMFDSTEEFDRSELIVRVLELDVAVDKIKGEIRQVAIERYKSKEMQEAFTTYTSIVNAIEDVSETFATIALIVS